MSQAITSMSMSSTKGGTAEAKKAGGSSDTSESSNSDAQNQSATRGQITMKDDSQQSMARFSKSEDNTQTTIIDPTSNDLIILFGHGDVTVTDKTTQTIETYLKNARDKKDGALSLILESSNDPNASSASLSREAELGRTLNVRNTLLGKNILPQAITVQNVEATKESDTYDWVKIHVEK